MQQQTQAEYFEQSMQRVGDLYEQVGARNLFSFLRKCAAVAEREPMPLYISDDEAKEIATRLTDALLTGVWANVAHLSVARDAGVWAMLQTWQRGEC